MSEGISLLSKSLKNSDTTETEFFKLKMIKKYEKTTAVETLAVFRTL